MKKHARRIIKVSSTVRRKCAREHFQFGGSLVTTIIYIIYETIALPFCHGRGRAKLEEYNRFLNFHRAERRVKHCLVKYWGHET